MTMPPHLFLRRVLPALTLALCPPTLLAQSLADAVIIHAPRLKIPPLPVYPSAELKAGAGSVVELMMDVKPDGSAGAIQSITSTPKSAAFEQAVTAAATDWKFRSGQTNCVNTAARSSLRVTFEPGGGAGLVAVKDPTPPLDAEGHLGANQLPVPNAGEVRRGLKYPLRARRAGASGDVVFKFQLNPVDGKLIALAISHSQSQPAGFEEDFIAAAREVFARYKFQPVEGKTQPITDCVAFNFVLG